VARCSTASLSNSSNAPYDRSAAGKVAQVVKVVVGGLRFLPARSCSAASVSRIVANAASMSSAVATYDRQRLPQRHLCGADRFVLDRTRNRQRQRPGRMLIGKEVLLLEKARRELRASEAAAHQVPSLHAITR